MCIKRPVLAWMIMLAAVVFGVVAAARIGISQMPDVDFPIISVSVTREGAAPEVIEGDVVDPLEEALVQVEGVKSITSVSRQGSASITLELDLARGVDAALQDVQARVSQAQQRLPRDVDPPVISKTNPEDQPIMWIALSGPYPRQLITDYARYRLREKLQTVPGVGEVMMGGYLERNVRVWVDARELEQRRLTVADVMRALTREHVELPAGKIETANREIKLRVLGEAADLETLRNIVIDERGPVYLKDVSLVEDGFEDAKRAARRNGEPAQGVGVKKQRGSNAVAVANGVKQALGEIEKTLPEDMKARIVFDSTKFIDESVHDIEVELVLSIVLTALVCWMFLGSLSSTLNVLLAIPMSLLGTVAVIYFLGFTLNTFTLLALALAVGIVVDDAIMVMENIFRHFEQGKDGVTAAREGTKEVTFAALAATLAVCAIFIPVAFMKGVVGKFFLQFGVTLSLAVLISYLEAVTLAPARCAQLLSTVGHEPRGPLGRLVDRGFDACKDVYASALERGLRRPWVVLVLTALLMAASVATMKKLPGEFVPSQDQGRLMVRMQTDVGANFAEIDRLFKRAEDFTATRPEIHSTFAVVGGFGGTGVNTGVMFVTMKPLAERSVSQGELMGVLRKELNSYPGLKAVVLDLSQMGFSAQRGFPIELSIRGRDWDKLVLSSADLKRKLAETGLVTDLDSDYQLGVPELQIAPDRARSADAGVAVEDIARTLNALVGGVRVGRYNSGGRRLDVRVRMLADQRGSPEDLGRVQVRGASGELLPLSSLVTQAELPALQAITRMDRERAISLFANVAPGHAQEEALRRVEELGKGLPEGQRLVLGGASASFRETGQSLVFALLLGIVVAYMILGGQFNSFVHPVTVLTILPLSLAGAVFALALAGKTLNMFSMIGILLLMGIVKKNSIILVDYATQLREERGLSACDAMKEAGPLRLRPILMTSLATMMAAIPAVLALGAGSETRAPMSIAVLGGLVVSTVLSLLVVPAFYVVLDRAIELARRLRASGRDAAPTGPG
ncbi:MAG: efflux RND transporter permease subunit [Deltaproteobacteria bacterium]|nr:efflux RND transporter permease subunit [Deltaproteobacteria bacterium]